MEAKFLASLFSFLSIFLAIYADALALNVNHDDDDSAEFELETLETAIYYGDSSVNLGEPFSITCIIPVTDPIKWTKDGEPISRHNLRHGRDEHSYVRTESPIEGERHKIEAHISVRHALKVHEGKYQCNDLHSSYHILKVRTPFTSDANELSTLAGYESIYDLTPNSVDELFISAANAAAAAAGGDDIGPLVPLPTLPTQATPPLSPQRNRQGHHHHHSNLIERRSEFMNNTAKHYGESTGDANYEFIGGLMHPSEYMPPTSNKHELTTVPWRLTPITRHGPPPIFPTPRTTWLTPTVATISTAAASGGGAVGISSPPLPHMPHVVQHQTPIYMHIDNTNKHGGQQQHPHHHSGAFDGVVAAGGGGVGTLEQPRFPLQTIHTTYQQHNTQQPTQNDLILQTFETITTAPLNPLHTNSPIQQIQTIHQQRPHQQLLHPRQHQQHQHQQKQLQQQQQHQQSQQYIVSGTAANPYTTTTTTRVHFVVPQTSVPMSMPGAGGINAVAGAATTITSLKTATTTTQKAKETGLIANYDKGLEDKKIVKYSVKSPLVLSCNDKTGVPGPITWLKNNTDVKSIKSLEGRHRIIAAENKFIIDKADASDHGVYSCVKKINDSEIRADINVVLKVVVSVPSNVGVVEGEKLSIPCTVIGTDVELKWIIDNVTIVNSTERYLLKANENNVENAILTIENVSLDDRGEYKCVGQNAVSKYEDRTVVRVKGKLAALWPFLGICAEVLILCAIILIYEKRRNKSELEESDTDPQDQQNPMDDHNHYSR